MRAGKRLQPDAPLAERRQRFREEFARLPEGLKALRSPGAYDVRISAALAALQERVIQDTKSRELPSG
jgi:hypothetical protein